MFAVRAATRAGAVARPRLAQMQRRSMGGGAKTAPPPGSFEEKVRGVLNTDAKMVCAIMGGYFGIYALFKLTRGKKEEPKVETIATPSDPASSSEEIPSGDAFFEWLEKPGSEEKWIASLEK